MSQAKFEAGEICRKIHTILMGKTLHQMLEFLILEWTAYVDTLPLDSME